VKLPPSYHTLRKTQGLDVHKLFFSFIWISLFKRAARHGILKEKRIKRESGITIKGSLLVRDSLISVRTKNSVRYQYQERVVDNIPNQILYRAFLRLKDKCHLSSRLLPQNLRDYIDTISQFYDKRKAIRKR